MCNISAGFFRDGKDEKEAEIIRTMLSDNRTVQEIATILHLPAEKVEKVKKTVLSQ